MSILTIAGAALGLAQSSISTIAVEPTHWAEFSRNPSRGQSRVTIRVGTVHGKAGDKSVYWAKRVGSPATTSIDSLTCPALGVVVEKMSRFEMPKVSVGGIEIVVIGDGTSYSLTLPASYHAGYSGTIDTLTYRSWGGPLAKWVDGSLAELEGCWPNSSGMN